MAVETDGSSWEGWDDPEDTRPGPAACRPTSGVQPAPASQPGGGARPAALPSTAHYAAHLHDTSASAYLYCSMAQVFREVGPESFKQYLMKVLEDAGNPTDPIERMLVEQICLAHHNTGGLYVKAAAASNLEEARVYLGAAALLTGEFRRSISTLKAYREPGKMPAARDEALDADAVKGVGNELASNGGGDDDGGTIHLPEPQAGRGREAQPGQASRPQRRRA